MSNGKFTLTKHQEEVANIGKAETLTELTTRFDLVADAAFHFFLIPFAIFVAAMAFFSGGLAAAFRKGLEILEGIRK